MDHRRFLRIGALAALAAARGAVAFSAEPSGTARAEAAARAAGRAWETVESFVERARSFVPAASSPTAAAWTEADVPAATGSWTREQARRLYERSCKAAWAVAEPPREAWVGRWRLVAQVADEEGGVGVYDARWLERPLGTGWLEIQVSSPSAGADALRGGFKGVHEQGETPFGRIGYWEKGSVHLPDDGYLMYTDPTMIGVGYMTNCYKAGAEHLICASGGVVIDARYPSDNKLLDLVRGSYELYVKVPSKP